MRFWRVLPTVQSQSTQVSHSEHLRGGPSPSSFPFVAKGSFESTQSQRYSTDQPLPHETQDIDATGAGTQDRRHGRWHARRWRWHARRRAPLGGLTHRRGFSRIRPPPPPPGRSPLNSVCWVHRNLHRHSFTTGNRGCAVFPERWRRRRLLVL